LTNYHKIDIFQSGIHRVAVEIFLVGKNLGKTSDKFMPYEDVTP
jgi:hypothetical protein